jgi:hypothetical protein
MKKVLLIFVGIIICSHSFGQIPTADLIKEYFLTNGNLENNATPGVNDMSPTGSARAIISDPINTPNNALSPNGDEFSCGNRGPVYGVTNGDVSVSFWIKTTTNSSTQQQIIEQQGPSGFGPYGWEVVLIDGKVRLRASAQLNGAPISNDVIAETTPIDDDNWHHIVAIVKKHQFWFSGWAYGPQASIYLDNEFLGSQESGGGNSLSLVYINPVAEEVHIAKTGLNFQENIDNIRVYNRAITVTDITELYKEYLASLSVLFVDEDATGADSGHSWSDAFTSLQKALTLASDGQQIWVADGTYHPDPTGRAVSFAIPSGVSVYGGFNGTEASLSQRDWHTNKTILSGDLLDNDAGAWSFVNTLRNDNSYHVVKLYGTNPTLDGVTVSDGHANGSSTWDMFGAGIDLNYTTTSPIVRNCVIENNIASVGAAGMFTRFGLGNRTVDIENCHFRKNLARIGGGYYGVTNEATLLDLKISGCLFEENQTMDNAAGDGLSASAIGHEANATGSVVSIVLANNTFVNNVDIGTHPIMNSNNRTVVHISDQTTQTTAEIHNCIFWGNTEVGGLTSTSVTNFRLNPPLSLTINNSIDEDLFSQIAPGNLINTSGVDPIFTDFANSDFTLSCLSPGVDAGDATGLTLPAIDLAGNGRIVATIDMGCYELIAYPSVTAVTHDITIYLDPAGNASITPSQINDNSGSTCGTAISLSLDQTLFTCADLGANTVTLTAMETLGGTSDASTAIVTVIDNIAPTVISQNITIQLDASGNATIAAGDINNGSLDNCTATGSLATSIDISSFTCSNIGTNSVQLTVDDGNGNTSTATAIVTVEDDLSPIAIAQNITAVIAPFTGSVIITPAMVDSGSTDNCSMTLSLSQTEFTCSETGDNTVTLTVTDGVGNISTIDAIVTIISPITDQTVIPTDNSLCASQSTTVLTGNSQAGIQYYLRDELNNIIDGPIVGTGSPLTFNTGVVASTSTFNVFAEEVPVIGDSKGLDFDGVNDRIVTTYTRQSSNSFTLEAWIKPTLSINTRIISNWSGAGSIVDGTILLDTYDATSPGTSLRLLIGGTSFAWSNHVESNCLTLNAWNHIAVVFNSGTVLFYVDGVQVHSSTSAITSVPTAPAAFHIAEDNPLGSSTEYFAGQMDEIRFWTTARSAIEISNNKDNCLNGTETGLETYYDFEATGMLTAIEDVTGNHDGYMYNMDYSTDYIVRSNGFTCGSNACALEMVQTGTVVIGDILAPVADLGSLSDATGSCEVTSLTAPTATDNCVGAITGTHNATFPISSNTSVTWTYDDGNGNTSTQTQNVVINDVVAPIADLASLSSVNSECEVTALTSPTATDDCLGAISGTHNATLPISNQGTTLVTWTYDDGNGNTSSQTQNIVITDVTPPVPVLATLPTLTEQCEVTSLTVPMSNDNCTGANSGTHNATLPITSNSTITWTYDDGNGNTSTQTQTVVINDNTAPVATIATLPVINEECQVTTLNYPTALDNCANSILGTHNATLPILSNTTITWSYDDGNGNVSTQIQNVVLNDVSVPIADLASLSTLNAQCQITALSAPTATDNCIGSVTGTHNATLPITSSSTITWTYDDGSGNISTQTQTVSINDNVAPLADIAALTAINSQCAVNSLTAPTATDNCLGAIIGTHNATFPIGTNTTVTWTYVDGNGNTATQTQDVVISDNVSPVLDDLSLLNLNAECSIASLTVPTATDNCAGIILGVHNATLPITLNTTITWTFDDGSGNVSTQNQLVVINDITAPVADLASLSDLIEQCEVTSLIAPVATDNCQGAIVGTHNATLPITASTSITWTYDDGFGNVSTQMQNVVLNDITGPVADLASLSDLTAVCEITSLIAPTATDNCQGAITGTHNATLPISMNSTITWTYDDGNGNTSTQSQNVVINDNSAPIEDLATLVIITEQCEVTSLTAPTATDNCVGTITGTHTTPLPILTTTIVTWTYDDGNGNSTTQTQEVNISDITDPVADAAALADITEECEVTSLTAPTATDNCSGTLTGTHNATLPITSNTTVTWTYVDGAGNTVTQDQDVVITPVDASISVVLITITATQTGADYQWVDCNDNNNPIPGETSQSFTPTANGSYAVEVTVGNCTETSICENITTIGIAESEILTLKLYPNPTLFDLTIETDYEVEEIAVFDVTGALIKKEYMKSFSVKALARGTYTLVIKTDHGIIRKRFVKQ